MTVVLTHQIQCDEVYIQGGPTDYVTTESIYNQYIVFDHVKACQLDLIFSSNKLFNSHLVFVIL